ncbi:MAG TPA: hypothetical protein VFA45_12825 [Actinomycetes bacterium]|nr:hypothetical protein [Actinomycetes bacterium]
MPETSSPRFTCGFALAVQALIAAFADGKSTVDEARARIAAAEVTGT